MLPMSTLTSVVPLVPATPLRPTLTLLPSPVTEMSAAKSACVISLAQLPSVTTPPLNVPAVIVPHTFTSLSSPVCVTETITSSAPSVSISTMLLLPVCVRSMSEPLVTDPDCSMSISFELPVCVISTSALPPFSVDDSVELPTRLPSPVCVMSIVELPPACSK